MITVSNVVYNYNEHTYISNTYKHTHVNTQTRLFTLRVTTQQSLLHVIDKGFQRGVKYFRRNLNNTLEQIPVVRTVKHLLDSLLGNRRVNIVCELAVLCDCNTSSSVFSVGHVVESARAPNTIRK